MNAFCYFLFLTGKDEKKKQDEQKEDDNERQ